MFRACITFAMLCVVGVLAQDDTAGAGAAAAAPGGEATFISVGDWGGHALKEDDYPQNTLAVALQMKKSAAALKVPFVIGTGDNFYWCGLQNTSDYQVKVDFVEPYLGESSPLAVPWYHVLGNHEYGYNVQAQLDLTNLISEWHLPQRYYTQRLRLGGQYLNFIFLDSSPCVNEYRGTDRSRYDPCGTQYPTCSISGGSDPFEGQCHFHENIMTQDCGAQFEWFKKQIAAVPSGEWKIVVAHHPVDEMDFADFTDVVLNGGVDLYLNGHAHTLTHYSFGPESPFFVTTGAGAMVDTADQWGGSPAKNRTYAKVHALPVEPALAGGQQYKQIWNQRVAGFTTHTLSTDGNTMTTKFISYSGQVVHQFDVVKGTRPSPPPGPPTPPPAPPSPPPSPAGHCCYYKDPTNGCVKGQTCCSDEGRSYTERTCGEKYGQKHNCAWDGTRCVVG